MLLLIMTDEAMLPRENIQYLQKSDIRIARQNWQISTQSGLHRRRDRMGLCCNLHLRYKREAENDLVVRHSQYSESNLECMGIDELLVGTC